MYASKIDELYLFYRLRFYASSKGGSIEGINLTRHERYTLLKRLIRRGWVKNNRVVSYRKVVNRKACLMVWSRISLEENMSSIEDFKGFIVAQAESYDLTTRYNTQKGTRKKFNFREKTFDKFDWEYGQGQSSYWLNVKKIENNVLLGRSFNSNLSRVLSLSTRTISRWRKFSKNTYSLRTYSSAFPYFKDRDISMMFKTRSGKFVTKDLTVSSNLEVFTMSHCKHIQYHPAYKFNKSLEENVSNLFPNKDTEGNNEDYKPALSINTVLSPTHISRNNNSYISSVPLSNSSLLTSI